MGRGVGLKEESPNVAKGSSSGFVGWRVSTNWAVNHAAGIGAYDDEQGAETLDHSTATAVPATTKGVAVATAVVLGATIIKIFQNFRR